MSITLRSKGNVYTGTLAEFTASARKFKTGDILLPTDSSEVRIGTGSKTFAQLISMPAQALQKAPSVAALPATTDLTAIAGAFADLAAARTAVNTLRSDAEGRLDAIEAKLNAVITALKTGNLMA